VIAKVAVVTGDRYFFENFSMRVAFDQRGSEGPVDIPLVVPAESLQVVWVNAFTGNAGVRLLGLCLQRGREKDKQAG
jgi:hypothetical protein